MTIWDPQGVNIVYDAALDDLRELEVELLTVGTYFIEKGEGLTDDKKDNKVRHHVLQDILNIAC